MRAHALCGTRYAWAWPSSLGASSARKRAVGASGARRPAPTTVLTRATACQLTRAIVGGSSRTSASRTQAQPKRRPPAKKPQARAKKAEPKPKQPAGAAAAPGAAGQGAIAAGEVTGSGAGSAQTATHVPPAMGPGSTAGGDGSGPGTTYGANQTAILHAQHEAQLAAARARAGQSGMGGIMPAYPQGVQPVQSVPSIDGAFHGSLVEHEELDRLVKRIDKRYSLEAEVKEALLEIADDFTETVSCALAFVDIPIRGRTLADSAARPRSLLYSLR